jgi:hypothetical protein
MPPRSNPPRGASQRSPSNDKKSLKTLQQKETTRLQQENICLQQQLDLLSIARILPEKQLKDLKLTNITTLPIGYSL